MLSYFPNESLLSYSLTIIHIYNNIPKYRSLYWTVTIHQWGPAKFYFCFLIILKIILKVYIAQDFSCKTLCFFPGKQNNVFIDLSVLEYPESTGSIIRWFNYFSQWVWIKNGVNRAGDCSSVVECFKGPGFVSLYCKKREMERGRRKEDICYLWKKNQHLNKKKIMCLSLFSEEILVNWDSYA